jgi:feruloyl-CoA synthase
MPGYWREPILSAEAFDAEGFYRTGDAVRWVDDQDIACGLAFDGRLAEDFKLDTGTFVSVGPLRAKVVAECGTLVQDVVVAGLDRAEIAVLLFPQIDECCRLPACRCKASPKPCCRILRCARSSSGLPTACGARGRAAPIVSRACC